MNLLDTLLPASPPPIVNARLIKGRCSVCCDEETKPLGLQLEYLAERMRIRKGRREAIKRLLKTGRFSEKQVSQRMDIHLETVKKDLRDMRAAGEVQFEYSQEKSGNQQPWVVFWV